MNFNSTLIAFAFGQRRRMLNLESSADQFSIEGGIMLSFIVRVIVEQLVVRILAAVIGAIL
jgi:hypothetical protein